MVTPLIIDENTMALEVRTTSLTLVRGSIVASIAACHAGDLGSIPGHGVACAVQQTNIQLRA